jgi:hypothetical protein
VRLSRILTDQMTLLNFFAESPSLSPLELDDQERPTTSPFQLEPSPPPPPPATTTMLTLPSPIAEHTASVEPKGSA